MNIEGIYSSTVDRCRDKKSTLHKFFKENVENGHLNVENAMRFYPYWFYSEALE